MANKVDDATKTASGLGDQAQNAAGGLVPKDPADAANVKGARQTAGDAAAPVAKSDDKGSLRIHINLDLDVEVHITARVKGDITIGLL